MAIEKISERLRSQRRLFNFVMTLVAIVLVPQTIGDIDSLSLRIGVTAAVIIAGFLAAPRVLQRIRRTRSGRESVAPALVKLGLAYVVVLAVAASGVLSEWIRPGQLGVLAASVFSSYCFAYSLWGMPDSLMFWRHPERS